MDASRLKQIEDIYHESLAVDTANREEFLSERCGSDGDLRAEVLSLLAFHDPPENFLSIEPGSLAAQFFDQKKDREEMIGKSIGHYKIRKLLGVGGMGEVYLSDDSKLKRPVALKFLPHEFSKDKDRLLRFEREARAASSLNHPNIITIYEIDEIDGLHFIATEYIDGKTLTALIKNNSLSVRSALEIAIQLASALSEAHRAGIVHRDVKPDNVMIRDNGLVKILDFGIAKLVDSAKSKKAYSSNKSSATSAIHRSTNLGAIIGTADYMSPEQARGVEISASSDIFSFGVMLFEMFCGRLPFQGQTTAEKIDAILNEKPAAIGETVPVEIKKIIYRCLEKSKRDRYSSANEVLADLHAASDDFDGQVEIDGKWRPAAISTSRINGTTTNRPPKQSLTAGNSRGYFRRNLGFLSAAALIFVLITALLAFYQKNDRKQILSIAVLPIVNTDGKRDVEFISDGMTEALISSLSSIPNLSVKGRSTSFAFKSTGKSPVEIGAELSVDAIVFGRLQRDDDRLKLYVELVSSSAGDIVWNRTYAGNINQLSTLQSKVAKDLAEELSPKLTSTVEATVSKIYTTEPEAQQLFLRGRFHWNKRTDRDLRKAVEYFHGAIEKDPNYALAYTGLAQAYALMPLYSDLPPGDYVPLAKAAATKALELDENLAEAHTSLGYIVFTFEYNAREAERHYQRAIELKPNYPTVHQWYAEFLAFRGDQEKALEEISKALELDPLSLVINRMKGNILSFANRHDEALAQLEKAEELYPEDAMIKFNLGDTYAAKKMYAQAVEQYLRALEISGLSEDSVAASRAAYQKEGWQGFWRNYLEEMLAERKQILEADKLPYLQNESLAFAYAANGNKEKALEYLNIAFENRDPNLVSINVSEVYEFLHDDPRYRSLVKKIGLTE